LPYLRRYGLAGFENLYPNALSGGMRQRVALMRTLFLDSDLVLLDEPFGALDAQTKMSMQEWLVSLWAEVKKTIVFVTHDVDEAIYLSDEIYVMGTRPGRIVERIEVSFPQPRSRRIQSSAEFVAIKERCLALISAGHEAEVLVA
jgi:ABC-type nitrate/sulfonate/bicarbonate transport system ATPase subunit